MKIAIPSMGKDLKSSISRKLGRAPFIIIYNSVSGEYDSIENLGFKIQDGSGQKSTEIILQNNIDVLLIEEIGRKAYSVLQKEHIKIQLLNSGGTVKSAINKYLKKKKSDELI
jgi:predicted Fe-Mo cluster-binding NifX family protein